MTKSAPFKLILLNMPIGRASDLSSRVRVALEEGHFFAVEDTRSFKELLGELKIPLGEKKIVSYHDQSSEKELDTILEMASQYGALYYASEAGSPALSDPAYPLVKAAIQRGASLDSYSGISSITMALELSGLPTLPYSFHGFFPREAGVLKKKCLDLSLGTHVFFEAPHRLEKTIEILAQAIPNASLVVLKELTKTYQDVIRGTCTFVHKNLDSMVIKGEFVVVLYLEEKTQNDEQSKWEMWLKSGCGQKDLAKILSEILQRPSKEIYQELTREKNRN
jgi:16S rRNA (cytidine1402-2'-O)-methyltransferase